MAGDTWQGRTLQHVVLVGELATREAILLAEGEDGAQPHRGGAIGVDVEKEREVVGHEKLSRLHNVPLRPAPHVYI